MNNRMNWSAAVIAGAMALASAAQADTLYVDDDNCPGPGDGSELDPYCSIQTAIDNAVVTDEIVVAPGTYFETINFLGKAITVRSTDPTDSEVVAATAIDGGDLGSVVTCDSGEGPLTILAGLTITNGSGPSGGGIRIVSSSPTVRYCVISSNTATTIDGNAQGGGIYVADGSPQVSGCTFSSNYAVDAQTINGEGGGIYHSGGSLAVTNCTFTANSAWGEGVARGGAIYSTGGSAVVTNCEFVDNAAADACDVYGGAVYGGEGTLDLFGCSFTGNEAWAYPCPFVYIQDGGAVYGADTVSNCTFTDNRAAVGGAIYSASYVVNCRFVENEADVFDQFRTAAGGGIYNAGWVVNCVFIGNSASNVNAFGWGAAIAIAGTVINCTFVGNEAEWHGGGIDSAGTVINCILWGNQPDEINNGPTVRYSNVEGGWPGAGNIDADPMFDAELHLSPGSPCIDAGHNWAIAGMADTDLDGNPRFAADENDFDPGCGIPVVVDMGAYEYQGQPFPVKLGDIDGNGTVNINDFLLLLGTWGPCVEDCCLADLDLNGDVGVTDFLILLANWG